MPTNNIVRWGLAGTGTIAREFAQTLAEVPSAFLTAAASRTAAASGTFCSEFDIPKRHLSFQDLAHDTTIDAVYVSTPAGLHHEHARQFLEAGKHNELSVSRYNPSGPGLQQSHTIHAPIVGGGLRYEIFEFHGLIEAGKPGSSVMPLSDSLAIMRTLDLIRHQIHQPSQEDPHRES